MTCFNFSFSHCSILSVAKTACVPCTWFEPHIWLHALEFSINSTIHMNITLIYSMMFLRLQHLPLVVIVCTFLSFFSMFLHWFFFLLWIQIVSAFLKVNRLVAGSFVINFRLFEIIVANNGRPKHLAGFGASLSYVWDKYDSFNVIFFVSNIQNSNLLSFCHN